MESVIARMSALTLFGAPTGSFLLARYDVNDRVMHQIDEAHNRNSYIIFLQLLALSQGQQFLSECLGAGKDKIELIEIVFCCWDANPAGTVLLIKSTNGTKAIPNGHSVLLLGYAPNSAEIEGTSDIA